MGTFVGRQLETEIAPKPEPKPEQEPKQDKRASKPARPGKTRAELVSEAEELGITVPKLLYYVDEITGNISTAIEWDGLTNLLIPPFIEYVHYKADSENKVILAKEFNQQLKKFMDNLQSFLPGHLP